LVAAPDLGSGSERSVGSSPFSRTFNPDNLSIVGIFFYNQFEEFEEFEEFEKFERFEANINSKLQTSNTKHQTSNILIFYPAKP
jgi:hypothetical protein